jgi:serine phosphatase RsbU (regulator of sigma subunit)
MEPSRSRETPDSGTPLLGSQKGGSGALHRLEGELELVREVQHSLFPADLPTITGYEIIAATEPRRRVSGEYYDVLQRRCGEECLLILADVAGAGMPASIQAGYLAALTTISIERGLPPHEILRNVSKQFFRKTARANYATMVIAVLEPAAGSLRYASAGHAPCFVVRASGDVVWLQITGLPIGVLADADYLTEDSDLEPGDLVVLVTAAAWAARDRRHRVFGAETVARLIAEHRHTALEAIVSHLGRTLDRFTAGSCWTDDRTVVIARRTG